LVTRIAAVAITFGVGAAGFALSFAALRDLATRGHVPAGQAWLWPLMVDGAILLATLGVVAMAGDPLCHKDRRFFWQVLAGGATVSIMGNALHAILPADEPLPTWVCGILAAVAPAALLVTTHGLTLLTRMHRRGAASAAAAQAPQEASDNVVESEGRAPAVRQAATEAVAEVPAGSRWHAAAERVMEHVTLRDIDRSDVAKVLVLSYERAASNREIGRSLGMSHHTVAKIIAAGANIIGADGNRAVLAAS
jgi:hypothetical protein